MSKFIIDNTNFKIANRYIESDGNGATQLEGLAKRDNGKFVVELGGERFESESYNNFLIDNNLIRVNTHVEDGSNYKRIGERSLSGNQVLEVGLEYRPPVEEEGKPDTSTSESTKKATTVTEPTLPGFDTPDVLKENVKAIAVEKSRARNVGRKLAEAIIGKDFVKQIKSVGGRYSLFPKVVIFSDKFNNIADANAVTNITDEYIEQDGLRIPPHVTVIGTKFLSYLDNAEDRPRAIRILMHEQLHQILHRDGNEKYIGSIKEIYDDFENAIKGTKDYDTLKKFLFTDEKDDVKLEEFLVESLTNKQLVDALNNIKVADTIDKSKKTSLFEKILRAISNIFGWDIKEGSLRAKEIEAFSKALSEIEKPKEETKVEDAKDKDTDTKVDVDEKQDVEPEVDTKQTNTLNDESVDVDELGLDDDIAGAFRLSSVGENSLDDKGVPVRNETVTDFGRYNKLSAEQKTAYERLREAGVLSITCHV